MLILAAMVTSARKSIILSVLCKLIVYFTVRKVFSAQNVFVNQLKAILFEKVKLYKIFQQKDDFTFHFLMILFIMKHLMYYIIMIFRKISNYMILRQNKISHLQAILFKRLRKSHSFIESDHLQYLKLKVILKALEIRKKLMKKHKIIM